MRLPLRHKFLPFAAHPLNSIVTIFWSFPGQTTWQRNIPNAMNKPIHRIFLCPDQRRLESLTVSKYSLLNRTVVETKYLYKYLCNVSIINDKFPGGASSVLVGWYRNVPISSKMVSYQSNWCCREAVNWASALWYLEFKTQGCYPKLKVLISAGKYSLLSSMKRLNAYHLHWRLIGSNLVGKFGKIWYIMNKVFVVLTIISLSFDTHQAAVWEQIFDPI